MQYAEDVEADMQAAKVSAGTLRAALDKVDALVGDQTWQGGAADEWEAAWHHRYTKIKDVLQDLPGATEQLVAAAREHDAKEKAKQGGGDGGG